MENAFGCRLASKKAGEQLRHSFYRVL